MDPSRILVLAFQASIVLTVFGFGLRATVADVLFLVRRPRVLVISLVSMFIVMPFIALVLALVIAPPQAALVALVTVSLSPVPPTLLGGERNADGRASYGLGLTATVSVLSIVLVPALVAFLAGITEEPFNIGYTAVATQVMAAVVLPLLAGMLVRSFLPRLATTVERPLALVAHGVLLAAVVFLTIAVFPRLVEVTTVGTVAAFVVFTVLGLAFGHIMGGPDPNDSRVLALASSLRHPGIALALATANFPHPRFGAVILLYLFVGAAVCIPYAKWMQKRSAAAVRTTDQPK